MSAQILYDDTSPKYRANKIFCYILVCLNILSPLFILLNSFSSLLPEHIDISLTFSAVLACIVLPISVVQYVFVYKIKNQNFARYFGVSGTLLIVGYLQTYFNYDFSLLFALVCFTACLYYSVRFSISSALLAYLVSLMCSTWKLFFKYYLDAEADLSRLVFRNFFVVSGEFFLILICIIMVATLVSLERRVSESKSVALQNARLSISTFSLKVMESHDGITNIHAIHSAKYCELICEGLVKAGLYVDVLKPDVIKLYSEAAIQHDIGKVHIPAEILKKRNELNEAEWAFIKSHTVEGRKILEGLPKIKTGEFNDVVSQMAFYHHEQYNGGGYPLGISGKSIPLCARIMSAAENIDGLMNCHEIEKPLTIDEVMEYFEEQKGVKFDPEITDVVLSLKDKISEAEKAFKAEELEKNESLI